MPMRSLEKVTSSGSETPEKPQMASRAASNRSRRRLRQFLEVHGDLTPCQSFPELRTVQPKSAGLKTELAGGHGVGQRQRKTARGGRRGGRSARRLHERKMFAGRPTWEKDTAQNHAQSVEMLAWMAEPVPISIVQALPAASLGGHSERAHTAGAQADGNRLPSGTADVLEGLVQLHKMELIGAKKGVLDNWSLIVSLEERNHQTKTGLGRRMRQLWPLLKSGAKDQRLVSRTLGIWNTVLACRSTPQCRTS